MKGIKLDAKNYSRTNISDQDKQNSLIANNNGRYYFSNKATNIRTKKNKSQLDADSESKKTE